MPELAEVETLKRYVKEHALLEKIKELEIRYAFLRYPINVEELKNNTNNSVYLAQKLWNKKAAIKSAIMDSRIVVGVGNIYAAESLFKAKIHPSRIAGSLSNKEIENLVISIKEVLLKAINAGGTSLKDFVNGNSKPGYFQQELNVYNRSNKSCFVCKNSIKNIKQAGRATYFCSGCQS